MELKQITVACPADRPDLAAAFSALEAKGGWRQHFIGRDESGEKVVVSFSSNAPNNAPQPPVEKVEGWLTNENYWKFMLRHGKRG